MVMLSALGAPLALLLDADILIACGVAGTSSCKIIPQEATGGMLLRGPTVQRNEHLPHAKLMCRR